MNKGVLKKLNQNKSKNQKDQRSKNMQGNKENESTNKVQQNTNKFHIDYYTNMSDDEFHAFCKRLLTLHKTGVYIPPAPKPRICNNKKRAHTRPREYIPQQKNRPTTFGEGRIGVSCVSFGVKNCECCRPENEAQDSIIRNIIPIQENEPQDKSKVYEQKIQEIMTGYNTDKSKENTNNSNYTYAFEIKSDSENEVIKNKSLDDFNKYDKKIQEILNKSDKCEKQLQEMLLKYNITESKEFVSDTETEVKPVIYDLLNEHDYSINSTIIIDSENESVPSTSFSKRNNSKSKVIDEIILLDSDNDDINTCEINKTTSAKNESNLKKQTKPVWIKPNKPKNVTTNINSGTVYASIVPSKGKTFVKSVFKFKTIDDSLKETKKVDFENKSPQRRGLQMLNCPICLETMGNKEIMSTICGHIFCSPCIQSCIRQTRKCPNCRKKLTLKSIHPIFF